MKKSVTTKRKTHAKKAKASNPKKKKGQLSTKVPDNQYLANTKLQSFITKYAHLLNLTELAKYCQVHEASLRHIKVGKRKLTKKIFVKVQEKLIEIGSELVPILQFKSPLDPL